MGNEKQRKTFLSYSRANKDFAIKLAKELKAEGFLVWLDQLDIPAGSRWDREVERALKESEIFMIILTQASVDSENVMDEIGYAIDSRKRFLPVLLENCDVPLRLRRFQYVDFTTKSFDEGVESAKELLRSLIAQTTIPRVEVPTDDQDQSGQAEREAQAEADRIAKQKADDELAARAKAETERKAKEESDRLAMQKAEADRIAKKKAEEEQLAKQKAEEERFAQAKAETDRKAKEEADRLAAQKVEIDSNAKKEADRLAKQKAEDERLAKAKAEAERKAKEEADRLAIQKAEHEARAEADSKTNAKAKPVEATPAVMKAATASAAAPQKKPTSKGLRLGVAAVVVLVIAGIGFNVLSNKGGNNNPSVVNPSTKVPTVTNSPPKAPPVATEPITGPLNASEALKLIESGKYKGIFTLAKEQHTEAEINGFLDNSQSIPVTLDNSIPIVMGQGWCATTQEILTDNLKYIQSMVKIDGAIISEDKVAIYNHSEKQNGTQVECLNRLVVITTWSKGKHTVHLEFNVIEKINDGMADYDPYSFEDNYEVTVP